MSAPGQPLPPTQVRTLLQQVFTVGKTQCLSHSMASISWPNCWSSYTRCFIKKKKPYL